MPILLGEEGTAAGVTVGEYWDRSLQIDLVGIRDDGRLELGECKWGSPRSSRAVLEELSAKAAAYPNPRNANLGLRIFTKHRVKPWTSAPYPVV